MSSALNSSFTAEAAKFGKEKPSSPGLIPLTAEVNVTLRILGALGSRAVEPLPEQADATKATAAVTAQKRCRTPTGITLLHFLSNY